MFRLPHVRPIVMGLLGLAASLAGAVEITFAQALKVEDGKGGSRLLKKVETSELTESALNRISTRLFDKMDATAGMAVLEAILAGDFRKADGDPETKEIRRTQIQTPKPPPPEASGPSSAEEKKDSGETTVLKASDIAARLEEGDLLGWLGGSRKKQPAYRELVLDAYDRGQPRQMAIWREGLGVLMGDRRTVLLTSRNGILELEFPVQIEGLGGSDEGLWLSFPGRKAIGEVQWSGKAEKSFKYRDLVSGRELPDGSGGIAVVNRRLFWIGPDRRSILVAGMDGKGVVSTFLTDEEDFLAIGEGVSGTLVIRGEKSSWWANLLKPISRKDSRGRSRVITQEFEIRSLDLPTEVGPCPVVLQRPDKIPVFCGKGSFCETEGGNSSRGRVCSLNQSGRLGDSASATVGPHGMVFAIFEGSDSLFTYRGPGQGHKGKPILEKELGEGARPVQVVSDGKVIYVLLGGRAGILVFADDLPKDGQVSKAKKKRPITQSTSASEGSPSLSSSSSVSSSSTTGSLSSSEGETTVPEPPSGETKSPEIDTFNMDHILEEHAYGAPNGKGQFPKGCGEDDIAALVRLAVGRATFREPSIKGRTLFGCTFKDAIGWVWSGNDQDWFETRSLMVVLDEKDRYAVTAYPVWSLPEAPEDGEEEKD